MAAIHVAALLSHPAVRSAIERALAARGMRGDTMLIHASPREAAMLRFMGGAGTINPRTGLRQFYVGGGPGGLAAGGDTETGAQASADPGTGGYGQADRGGNGSGLGAGGGHSGQSYYSQTMYNTGTNMPGGARPATYAPPTTISNMPPPAAPSLTPMMSSTSPVDLASSRFGALPSWATTPYQIGMAPTSYPTPGVNAALGAPGTGGGGLPGGGGTAPGIGGGTTGGITPIGGPGGVVVRTPAGLGVQLPGGAVALLNLNGPPAIGGGSINTPTLPNGQTLSQYLGALRLGLPPRMPGAPTATGATPSASQPVANQLAVASQAAPGAFQQLHPAVANALAQGLLGGTIPNYAQQVIRGKVTSGSR